MKEEKAADLLLGEGSTNFTVRCLGVKILIKIKLITTRRLIRIAREMSHVAIIDPTGEVFVTELENAKSLRYIAKSIAISTGIWPLWPLVLILERLPLASLLTLWKTVVVNSDPDSFFFIMALSQAMRKMKTTKSKSEGEPPSSADLP